MPQSKKKHTCFLSITIALAIGWCFVSGACSEKKQWQPELAISAVTYNIDPGFYLNIQEKAVDCLTLLRDSARNTLVFTTLNVGLSEATKERYPDDCREQIDSYITKYILDDLQPGDALSLVADVSAQLAKGSSSELLNGFYYALLTRLPDYLIAPIEELLYNMVIVTGERIGFELASLVDSTSDNLLSMDTRLTITNNLKPDVSYQLSFLQNGTIIDQLLPNGSEVMPKGRSIQTSTFDRQRIEHVFNATDFWLDLKSDTLRMGLNDLQTLHLQTISITVGLKLKLNLDGKLSEI